MEVKYEVLGDQINPDLSSSGGATERGSRETGGKTTVIYKKGERKPLCLYLILVTLVIVAVVGAITTLSLAIALGVRSSQTKPASGSDTCVTPGCVQLAAQIAAAMNQSADPCEDFYEFSCGGWMKNNFIPQGGQLTSQLLAAQELLIQRMVRVIKGGDGGVEAVRKVIKLYQSCINSSTIESRGVTPVLDLFTDPAKLGGWPLIGIPETVAWSINSRSFFYEKVHGSQAFFNMKAFFNAVTMSRSKYAIHFEQQSFVLQQLASVITIDETVKILTYFNPNVDQTVYTAAVQSVIAFDAQISQIRLPPLETPNITNVNPVPLLNESNLFTIGRLQQRWPGFDWQGFINYMYSTSGLTVPPNIEVVITTPVYFDRLDALLRSTDINVIRDYARFFFLLANIPSLDNRFAKYRNIRVDPTRLVLHPKPGDLFTCMEFVEQTLPIALARPFVEQFVPEGTRENVTMMTDYILQSFRERVNAMSWLSEFSKRRTIEKVEAITLQAAYPQQIFDNDYVNGLYSTLTVYPNDFFGNHQRIWELFLRLRLNLTYGFDKTQWPTDPDSMGFPTMINAFYFRHTNRMYVLAAFAIEPFFRADWPEYFMFGALGSIVGHEITHGFDVNGRLFDKDGVRRMWWSNYSQAEFQSRLQCFVDQYNQFSVMGVKVNGNRTLAENIADNGGLNAAFRAFRMRLETQPQVRLPSLSYTPEQLFFVAFAQTWCEIGTPQYYQLQRTLNNHAPGPARVRAVANLKEFSEAFNCPAGSPMNPPNKCMLW